MCVEGGVCVEGEQYKERKERERDGAEGGGRGGGSGARCWDTQRRYTNTATVTMQPLTLRNNEPRAEMQLGMPGTLGVRM